MSIFDLQAPFKPMGDQPQAIDDLVDGINRNLRHQTLLGATGTGKTFTMANIIQRTDRPALIFAHNKTLAAQLYSEFREFFPNNAVEYFVSYYDYYQPESYVPRRDLFIEKETDINEEIERLRLAATSALFSRRDTIIVASVSCIYGLGSPIAYGDAVITLKVGDEYRRNNLLRDMVQIHYTRNDTHLDHGQFAVRGDTLEVMPGHEKVIFRVDFFGDEIDRLMEVHAVTGEVLGFHDSIDIFPARHFVTEDDKLQAAITDIEQELEERIIFFKERNMLLEAQRIEQRTHYDLEMLREVGYCSGIENYSRHMDQRAPGTHPWSLLDFFPPDFLMFIDESHMSLPQIRGMYAGDQARKTTLVDYGFRLPSALDNRPLNFDEFENSTNQMVYVSATPGPYEKEHQENEAQQIIRPTGLTDPHIDVRPVTGQIDDLVAEINKRINDGQRVLVTTLTKRMSEDLANYLLELGMKVTYLHSEIQAIERVEILRDLRMGVYDVLIGINLLREGLDLPEVSLVAILDADKEGFLRSTTALIQTIGRAARHVQGQVIMYANKITDSMRAAIDETNRRRDIQIAYNKENGIVPASIVKSVRDITDRVSVAEEQAEYKTERTPQETLAPAELPKQEIARMIRELESQMKTAAKVMEYEKAALLRDQIMELRRIMVDKDPSIPEWQKHRRLSELEEA